MNERGDPDRGRVVVDVDLANYADLFMAQAGTLASEKVRRLRLRGLVDSGTARLVLPESAASQLGLPSAGETMIRYPDGRTGIHPLVDNVWVQLLGREGNFKARVEPDRTDVLIGFIVLGDLDLIVDHSRQALVPRDPDYILSEAEWADQSLA